MAGSLANITNIAGSSHTDNQNNNNYDSEKIWHFMRLSVRVCALCTVVYLLMSQEMVCELQVTKTHPSR